MCRKNKLKIYTAWAMGEKDIPHALSEGMEKRKFVNGTLVEENEIPLYTIDACSWEEAMSIYNLRRGFGAYIPEGKAEPCPECGALYYPKGSGECWSCEYEC